MSFGLLVAVRLERFVLCVVVLFSGVCFGFGDLGLLGGYC